MQTSIIIFVVIVLITALSVTGLFLANATAENIEKHQAEKARGATQTVSEVPFIKKVIARRSSVRSYWISGFNVKIFKLFVRDSILG